MTALVTGAQGFIGSWLVSALLDRGERVLVLERPLRSDSRFVRERQHERTLALKTDLADPRTLCDSLTEHEVDTVFHLAAQTLVAPAREDPSATFATNVAGTWTLLEACRHSGLGPRVVVGSSYHVYGQHAGDPYREGSAFRATHPYDVSKACADLIAQSYAATYALPVAVVRESNVYGGGDLHYSRLVPDVVRALLGGRAPRVRSHAAIERDFLYVEDAADAYLTVADSLSDPRYSAATWNVGSGASVPIIDVVERLVAASGVDLEVEVEGSFRPRDEIDRQVLDCSAIREELGWEPRHDLHSGLEKTWQWYEQHREATLPAGHG